MRAPKDKYEGCVSMTDCADFFYETYYMRKEIHVIMYIYGGKK